MIGLHVQRFPVQVLYSTAKNKRYPSKTKMELLLLDINKTKASFTV